MDSHHFGSKWGSYIHWKAFSAFWVSVWICALSPLTLCSLNGKKGTSKEKMVGTETKKEGYSSWKKLKQKSWRKKNNIERERDNRKTKQRVHKTVQRWRVSTKGRKENSDAQRDWKGQQAGVKWRRQSSVDCGAERHGFKVSKELIREWTGLKSSGLNQTHNTVFVNSVLNQFHHFLVLSYTVLHSISHWRIF